jgi:hypothetical protein
MMLGSRAFALSRTKNGQQQSWRENRQVPRDWRSLVDGFTPVQKLVHLAMRLDDFEVDRIKGQLLRTGRMAYENELTAQARLVGCKSRRGQLTSGPSLSALNDLYLQHATGIVNTYNYDLAGAILAIRSEVPTANRHVYARRLQGWDSRRKAWKNPQVEQSTTGYARAMAQRDFHRYNNIDGVAVLRPEAAACPVCAGWVARGEVNVRVAANNPPPYHPNCPHLWRVRPGRVPAGECADLWMGE